MNTYDIIKYWDDHIVEQHIGSELMVIESYLKEQNKSEISYIDIGANSGKYHDVLAKNFNIKKCIMIEASKSLYDYLLVKFQNKQYEIYNMILSDTNGSVDFADIDFSYITELNSSINLGLSKAYNSDVGSRIQVSASDFFVSNVLDKGIHELDLIKIDTENRDYFILKSITPHINKLKSKPLICFENNYHNDMSQQEAQSILDNFSSYNNYSFVNINEIRWSSVFLYPLK